MTARQSWRWPSLSHILPESRIMAGMEASMMMSEGTCRLVIPLSESTMARSGPSAMIFSRSASSWVGGAAVEFAGEVAEAVFEVDAELVDEVAVLGEKVAEERRARRGRR